MSTKTIVPVRYSLSGVVNNTQLDAVGSGEADFDAGTYRMKLKVPKVPMHWDPAFVILICCDRMLGVCARQEGTGRSIHALSGGQHMLAWRTGHLYDDRGRECGWAQASSVGTFEDGVLTSRSQLLQAHFHLELEEQITRIHTPYRATMMPFGDDIVLVTSAYSFETNMGNTYRGFTTYPYKMRPDRVGVNNLAGLQELTVESVNLDGRKVNADGVTEFEFEISQVVTGLSAK